MHTACRRRFGSPQPRSHGTEPAVNAEAKCGGVHHWAGAESHGFGGVGVYRMDLAPALGSVVPVLTNQGTQEARTHCEMDDDHSQMHARSIGCKVDNTRV